MEESEKTPEKAAEASMDEIVRFLLSPMSRLEKETTISPRAARKEERFFVLKPIREVDKFNAYKMNNLDRAAATEIPTNVKPNPLCDDYNCAEYKVWLFNHLQCRSFWDDIVVAGLFD